MKKIKVFLLYNDRRSSPHNFKKFAYWEDLKKLSKL